MRRRTVTGTTFDILNTIFMIVMFIITIYPFLYIFNYSVSSALVSKAGLLLIPRGFNVESYITLMSNPSILNGMFISVARTTIGSFGMIIVTTMAAYALARNDLWGKGFLNKFLIFTMYFSGGLIPVYLVIKELHLIGSFWVYIFPQLANAFYFILVKTFIESIPKSLEEAALIDGASHVKTFYKVILPVCAPVVAAILLFSCVTHWNSFIDNQLYNSMNKELFTMQYVLYNFLMASQVQSQEQAQAIGASTQVNSESLKMAITIITIIPILFVYPFLQRYFISGLMVGSVKG